MGRDYENKIFEQMERYHSEDKEVRDAAMIEILDTHKGLITFVLQKHFKKYCPEYAEDLISCGKIGIIKALEEYDPNTSKPSTFFCLHILHEMYDFITRFVLKTTPYYASEIKKVKEAMAEYEDIHSDEPTVMDLAMATGLSTKNVTRAIDIVLFGQTKNYESESYLDGLLTEFDRSPEERMIETEELNALYEAILKLPETERMAIIMKFGLGNSEPYTNSQIAVELGIPLEKVRSTIQKAITKLKKNKTMYNLFTNHLGKIQKTVEKEDIAIVRQDEAKELLDDIMGGDPIIEE